MIVEKVEVLRVKNKYFEVKNIVNIEMLSGKNFEQVSIDFIKDDWILIDVGYDGTWLNFCDIKDINMY